MAYKLLFGFDVLVALVFVYFFLIGLGDGSVSSYNMALWLGILAALAAVLVAGNRLHAAGRPGPALAVLAVVAVPGLLYVLFFGLVLVTQPRWN
jgi:uncharacterized membrane protein YhaH (DUF805 family)